MVFAAPSFLTDCLTDQSRRRCGEHPSLSRQLRRGEKKVSLHLHGEPKWEIEKKCHTVNADRKEESFYLERRGGLVNNVASSPRKTRIDWLE